MCSRKIRLYRKIRILIRIIKHNTVQAHNQQLQICQSVRMFPRPCLMTQTADRFLNNNPKHKMAMFIHAILSEEKDPPGLPVPVPVPHQILVLPNDHIWNPDEGFYPVYTRYIPGISDLEVYTWYIPGISRYIPGILMWTQCLSYL